MSRTPKKRPRPSARAPKSSATKAAEARGEKRKPEGEPAPGVQRLSMSRLRTLGNERNPRKRAAPAKGKTPRGRKALEVLEQEFERVFALKEKLGAEARIGGTEKGRDSARHDDKLRSLVASLEGMSRFAMQMGLITPAESRELYARAMKRGLYAGWR